MAKKTILFSINKGGTGKTTSACAIAQVLASCDYKVLFVDLDSQKNSTRVFDAEIAGEDVDFIRLLTEEMDKKEVQSMVSDTNFENISIIAANSNLYDVEDELFLASREVGEKGALTFLKKNLNKIKKDYDYIIMDTSPTINRTIKAAVAAADEVLTTCKTESFSTSAIGTQIELVSMVNNICDENTKFKGVVFTGVKERSEVVKAYREALKEDMGEYYIDMPIRDCIKVMNANSTPVPLFSYAPKCTAAIDYVKLTVELGLIDKEKVGNLIKKYKNFM